MFEIKPAVVTGYSLIPGLEIKAPFESRYAEILSDEALRFLYKLHTHFNSRRKELLAMRQSIQADIDRGKLPQFLPETQAIRNASWTVAPLPADLRDRRVEITGPVDRKMIINAMNSGARVFMADFEDSNTPSWSNVMDGQVNLRDAVRRTITYTPPSNGKIYKLNSQVATLMVRPRGWHLTDKNIIIEGEPISGSLMDFGLYFFHNARHLLQHGSGPYFYLPKLESYREARLWNDVFVFSQIYLGIGIGKIKATVLIETILASFQMHEILWELRDHSAGLNCGRWDYIFSFIKKFRNLDGYLFPDRSQVTMTVPCMQAYSQLLVQTCHQRGAHAMGGMAAQIPIKNNPQANEDAIQKVRTDKLREVLNGHDGTWVAHPGLVQVALDIFNTHMPEPNQIHVKKNKNITAEDLLKLPEGSITEKGIRTNIHIGILYIESWLKGNGAAALYNLMEDAATAEICRTQIWQWLHRSATLDDGRRFTFDLYEELRDDEIQNIRETVGCLNYCTGRFTEAIALFNQLVVQPDMQEFLTLPAYKLIN